MVISGIGGGVKKRGLAGLPCDCACRVVMLVVVIHHLEGTRPNISLIQAIL
jgi:hypothetical protein